jgi:hypothetical protein
MNSKKRLGTAAPREKPKLRDGAYNKQAAVKGGRRTPGLDAWMRPRVRGHTAARAE